MAVGIIQPRSGNSAPGTVTILERQRESNPTVENTSGASVPAIPLQYDKIGRFVLVPQPSNDPNDPLNLPLWKRDLILLALCLISVIATVLSPILAATSFGLLYHFTPYVGFTKIALLTGYHLLGVGVAGAFFVPSARVWGKRHLYLLGTILVCVTSVWGGVALEQNSYTSFLWARILQGVGLAPFEALVNASVGDLFYVHERGKRMALSTLAVFGSAFFAPVVVGTISATQGVEWSFYWVAILSGALFPLVFFCIPETAFVRADDLNTDFGGNPAIEHPSHSGQSLSTSSGSSSLDYEAGEASATSTSNEKAHPSTTTSTTHHPRTTSAQPPPPPKRTYMQSLSPFNGRKTHESYLKLLLRPFPLFFHPGVLWACLTQGVLIGWTVLMGIVLSAIFVLPPLYFDEQQTGYLFTSAFIGAVAGFVICGAIADPLANYLTRRNGGVYEPEFRIPLVALQLLFGGIGLYGFGITSDNLYKYGWLPADVFFGFVLAGMVCGAVASALYLVDAHREIAIESFTSMMIFKNIFSFALTFRGYDWIQESGPRKIFIVIGSVQVVVCLLSVGMYIFGKVNRAFWGRHDILSICRLR